MLYRTCKRMIISIHALREEGDVGCRWALSRANKFLSTPSARRATVPDEYKYRR